MRPSTAEYLLQIGFERDMRSMAAKALTPIFNLAPCAAPDLNAALEVVIQRACELAADEMDARFTESEIAYLLERSRTPLAQRIDQFAADMARRIQEIANEEFAQVSR